MTFYKKNIENKKEKVALIPVSAEFL